MPSIYFSVLHLLAFELKFLALRRKRHNELTIQHCMEDALGNHPNQTPKPLLKDSIINQDKSKFTIIDLISIEFIHFVEVSYKLLS